MKPERTQRLQFESSRQQQQLHTNEYSDVEVALFSEPLQREVDSVSDLLLKSPGRLLVW